MAKNKDPYIPKDNLETIALNYAMWLRHADREKHPEITFDKNSENVILSHAREGVNVLMRNKDPELRPLKRELAFEASGSAGIAIPSDLIRQLHYEVFDQASAELGTAPRTTKDKKELLSLEEAENRGIKPSGRFV